MSDSSESPEIEELHLVQRSAAALSTRLKALSTLRWKAPTAARDLERAVESVGDPATFSNALQATLDQANELLRRNRSDRSAAATRAIAGFVRDKRDLARETAAGWRVGVIELEVRAEDGSARALYNREVVLSWAPIPRPEDVADLHAKAERLVHSQQIPEALWASAFAEAFEISAAGHEGMDLVRRRVELRSVLEEVQVVLTRRALRARKRTEAVRFVQMPMWALLFNVDRYRAAASSLPAGERLTFVTGSQRETARIGVTLNGLDPFREYERFCFVDRARGVGNA